MSRTRRGEGETFDNIIAGSAMSSLERTISGALPPADLAIWADNITVGNAQPTTVRADNYIAGTATPIRDNVKVGG